MQHDRPRNREAARKRERRRWIALAVLCLGQLMMVLDATIVNVALPSIQRDLHFTQGNLTWVIERLPDHLRRAAAAGRADGRPGRAQAVFLTGLVLFTAASVLCGLADSQAMLIGARLLQGVGGAVASSVILAIIVTEFPEAARAGARRWACTRSSRPAAARSGCSPGGALTQSLDWHWIFFVNVPIGVIAFVLGSAADRGERGHRPGRRRRRARLGR